MAKILHDNDTKYAKDISHMFGYKILQHFWKIHQYLKTYTPNDPSITNS